jgi:hypothetical protein
MHVCLDTIYVHLFPQLHVVQDGRHTEKQPAYVRQPQRNQQNGVKSDIWSTR